MGDAKTAIIHPEMASKNPVQHCGQNDWRRRETRSRYWSVSPLPGVVGFMNRIHCVGLSAPTPPYAMPRRRPQKYSEADSQLKFEQIGYELCEDAPAAVR